jgi:hypothetical protein
MITPLRLLALAACFHAIALSGRPVFLGVGNPRGLFHMQTIRAVVMLVLIYPLAIKWGITGATGAMVISNLAMFIYWSQQIVASLDIKLKDFYQLFCPSVIATAIMSIFLIQFSILFKQSQVPSQGTGSVLIIIGMLIAGLGIYILALRLIQPLFRFNQPVKAFGMFFRR